MRFNTIVVGVDFTPQSRDAAAWVAAAFADAHLILVHACRSAAPGRIPRQYATGAELDDAIRRGARERLDELAAELSLRDITLEARTGEAHEVLAAVAAQHGADLLVIGPHTPRPGLRRLLGSTGETLMRSTALPVLLVGDDMAGVPRRILTPIDGSPITADVLRSAAELAGDFDASLTSLHVHDTATYAALSVLHANDAARVRAEALRETALWFDQYREAAGLERGDVELTIGFGEARHEILAMAQQTHADLIVMGSHGGGGAIFRRVVGSVAAWVLRYTRKSVLVLQSAPAAARSSWVDSPALRATVR